MKKYLKIIIKIIPLIILIIILYFTLFSKDEENEKLMNDVLALMDKENEGTPTVIIGDEVIVGYGEDMNSTFEASFQSEKDNEYDVIKKYQEQ